jgi:hypothetical protein
MSVRPADLTQAMLDTQPQIVHFSGHGSASGALCFDRLPLEYCGRHGAIASGRAALSPEASSRHTLWCRLATDPSEGRRRVRVG